MPGGSIYVQRDDKYTGASPQWYYEKYWYEDTRSRQRSRALKAAIAFAVVLAIAIRFSFPWPAAFALSAAGLAALADWWWAWRAFRATAVWRGRRQGEAITGRLLRRSLRRYGYRVLDGRAIKGQASIDHLVIGPGGLWIVDNESWSPDTEIATYGARLFFGEKYGTSVAKPLASTASAFAALLSSQTGVKVTIRPMLAVHCGMLPKGGMVAAEGVTLAKPHLIAKLIRAAEPGVLTPEQVELLARTAARELQRV